MSKSILVEVSDGLLEGLSNVNEYDSGKEYFSFQGIPYAQPPIGDQRFKAPRPVEPWKGIKDATKDGQPCFARNLMKRNEKYGSEDCLTLNVYTSKVPSQVSKQKNVNRENLKPVMVFIHGGAFINGSNTRMLFGPEFLLREDVVLVVINYRLGLLGFLALEDSTLEVPGNAGLKDMVLALKWVKKNIECFNGDPDNVTIFGVSAGAASVHLLVLSPLAEGLFHRAIIQSGCALNPWVQSAKLGPLLAELLEMSELDEKKLLQKLQSMTVEELHNIQEKLPSDYFVSQPWDASALRPIGFAIEKPNENCESFLTEDPEKLLREGRYNHVPLLMGFTSAEGMLINIGNNIPPNQLMPNYQQYVPHMLNLEEDTAVFKEVARKILEFYMGNDEIQENCSLSDFYNLTSDDFFIRDIYRSLVLHSEHSNQPLYLYEMNLDTSNNIFKKMSGIQAAGACHADDQTYLFKTILHQKIEPGSPEDLGIRRFCRLWANFAKYGNPTPIADPLLATTWKPFDLKEKYYLDIDNVLSLKKDAISDRMKFWNDIFSNYRRPHGTISKNLISG